MIDRLQAAIKRAEELHDELEGMKKDFPGPESLLNNRAARSLHAADVYLLTAIEELGRSIDRFRSR